ncbi:MAG: hypothetical protein KGI54_18615 [Pseudomonadota bacterium]|nr:hypothetical protein [Pseudomonadota bacterium]
MTIPTHEEVEALAARSDEISRFAVGQASEIEYGNCPTTLHLAMQKSLILHRQIASSLRALDAERRELRAQLASARDEALQSAEKAVDAVVQKYDAEQRTDEANGAVHAILRIRSLMTPEEE